MSVLPTQTKIYFVSSWKILGTYFLIFPLFAIKQTFAVCEKYSYVSVTWFVYVYIFSKVRPECVLADHLSVGQPLHETLLILCGRPQRLHWVAAAPAIRSSWAARCSSPPPCSRFGSPRAHRAPVWTVGSSLTYHQYFAPQLESSPRNPGWFVRYNFTPFSSPAIPEVALGVLFAVATFSCLYGHAAPGVPKVRQRIPISSPSVVIPPSNERYTKRSQNYKYLPHVKPIHRFLWLQHILYRIDSYHSVPHSLLFFWAMPS